MGEDKLWYLGTLEGSRVFVNINIIEIEHKTKITFNFNNLTTFMNF